MSVFWVLVLFTDILLLSFVISDYKSNGYDFEKPLIILVSIITGWVLVQLIIQLIFHVDTLLLLHDMKYVFVIATPSILKLFVRCLINRPISRKAFSIELIVDSLFIIGIVSNVLHHQFRSADVKFYGMGIQISYTHAWLFYAMMFYVLINVLYTLAILIHHHISKPEVYRKQTRLMISGIIIMLVLNIIFHGVDRYLVYEFDFSPIGFGLMAWLFYYVVYIYSNPDLSLFAKDLILKQLGVGLLFLDDNDEIFYMNQVCEDILELKLADVIYKKMDVLSSDFASIIREAGVSDEPQLLSCTDERICFYRVSSKILHDDKERLIGTMISFQDVTEIETERIHESIRFRNESVD